ncbi:sulfate transporter CysZ [Ostreibacterium oceani]|uniref:Sulfate transporter CysZ n=1 Tax=Ostreibacterium oceani TaxID=2654998 RepID=A0A6N7EWJ7_9GAMM|nr:sulfate transporter CysZ [Ostreibacterium oceani]MPV85920.1 sulfate transporter CysZ [Ostreibacterium oceani]
MINDFIQGIKYALSGFSWIVKPSIRRFVYLPLLINTLFFSVAIWFVATAANRWIAHWLGEKADWVWGTQWLYDWAYPVLSVLIYVTLALVTYFLFLSVANVLAAPFNAWLAKSVEKQLTNQQASFLEMTLWQEIRITVQSELFKLLRFLIVAMPLLLLLFIPVLNGLFPLLWLLFMSSILALQYIDYPMANHGYFYATQRRVLKQNRWQGLGFGLAANVMLFIPVVNFLAMPVCVCGATVWWHDGLRDAATKK